LYWDFLARNEERLKGNPRLAMPYRTLARMDAERRAAISADARRFLSTLDGPAHGVDQLALEIWSRRGHQA
jgi:deoxyribodipyrimidine photolyase-related protein